MCDWIDHFARTTFAGRHRDDGRPPPGELLVAKVVQVVQERPSTSVWPASELEVLRAWPSVAAVPGIEHDATFGVKLWIFTEGVCCMLQVGFAEEIVKRVIAPDSTSILGTAARPHCTQLSTLL